MTKSPWIVVVLGVMPLGCIAAHATAQEKLAIKNDTPGFMQVWVWKERNSRWDRPPIAIHRGEKELFDIAAPGQYYLVARDDLQRDFHIGWFDFHDAKRKTPILEIRLSKVYASETDVVWRWNPGCAMWEKTQRKIDVSKWILGWRLFDADSGPTSRDSFGVAGVKPAVIEGRQGCPQVRRRLLFNRR